MYSKEKTVEKNRISIIMVLGAWRNIKTGPQKNFGVWLNQNKMRLTN